MDIREIEDLKGTEATLKKLYVDALKDGVRKNYQDARFTVILSEVDMRRLDFISVIMRQKRAAMARELISAALSDAEKLLGITGWEILTDAELPKTAEETKGASLKPTYAAVVRGLLPYSDYEKTDED
ncbi:hypothetical protein [Paenibacillus sp. YIM B09110]|uniref:hypothetical protein n=1 Tax=Paenibacillus sp. YIM B09110 TaxID=3126102 RepID=UPI00301CB18A